MKIPPIYPTFFAFVCTNLTLIVILCAACTASYFLFAFGGYILVGVGICFFAVLVGLHHVALWYGLMQYRLALKLAQPFCILAAIICCFDPVYDETARNWLSIDCPRVLINFELANIGVFVSACILWRAKLAKRAT